MADIMRHHELDCITDACVTYGAILDAAEEWATDTTCDLDPEAELRATLPLLFAQLSPEARSMMADHLDHVRELVAHFHVWHGQVNALNRRSA